MRTALALAALTVSSSAFAGGVGTFGHFGFHTDQSRYYINHDLNTNTPITNPLDFPQREVNGIVPQIGGGFEFLLGDRDDKIIGVFRGYWMMDGAQSDPADGVKDIPREYLVPTHRDFVRHTGVATMGLNVGVVGSTEGLLFGGSGHLGAGALTADASEFLLATVGPMVQYRMNRALFGYAELHYSMRYRKGFHHGATGQVGIRYQFD